MPKCPRCGKSCKTERGLAVHMGHAHKHPMVIDELPQACPTCGSTDLKCIPGIPNRIYQCAGKLNGRIYDRIVYRHKQCEACGQRVLVRTYETG